MAITAGKLMLTMMHPEMLFVAHVHQPIVASPTVQVDDASRVPDPELRSVAASWRRQGRIFDTFPWRSRIPKTIGLPPATRTLFSANTACAKIKIHRLHPHWIEGMKRYKPERF